MAFDYEDAKGIAITIFGVLGALWAVVKGRSSLARKVSSDGVAKIYHASEGNLLDRLQRIADDNRDRADKASQARYDIAIHAAGLEVEVAGLRRETERLRLHTEQCDGRIRQLEADLGVALAKIISMQDIIDRRLKPRRE